MKLSVQASRGHRPSLLTPRDPGRPMGGQKPSVDPVLVYSLLLSIFTVSLCPDKCKTKLFHTKLILKDMLYCILGQWNEFDSVGMLSFLAVL